jgi:hypothetical protein
MKELSFILGGAPRSGTTCLAAALDAHPRLWMLKPFVPEPKIFILPGEKTPEGYGAEIAARAVGAPEGRILGEKTSYYFESDEAARRIARTLPKIRMLFILREPVARAYSNYLWSKRNGLENLSFEEAVAAEGTRADGLPAEKSYVRPHAYLERGRYGTHAQRWLRLLNRSRLLFLLYEDLVSDPAALLARVHDFLGVSRETVRVPKLERLNASDPTSPPIPAAVRRQLKAFFADEVALFAKVTGENVSAWSE